MNLDRPEVRVMATFLTTDDGGRQQAPVFGTDVRYSSHIVIQPPDIRESVADPDGMCREPYLGVDFIDGPKDYCLGQSAEFLLLLAYHPRVDYTAVAPDATFTLREGGRVVGFGVIISRVM